MHMHVDMPREGVSAYACCHAPWHPDMDMHVVMSPGKMPGALEMPGGMSTCICMSIYQDQGASQHEKNMHFRMPGGHVKMHILPSQDAHMHADMPPGKV